MLDIEIPFGKFDDSFDHDFAAINEIRFFKRIILLKALFNDDGQLGTAQNDLGAVVLFLELLEENDEVVDDFFSLVSGFDPVNDILKKGLVLRAWDHWFDSTSQQTLLEKTCVDAASSSKDSALLGRLRKKNIL